jgi:hypothetical protein
VTAAVVSGSVFRDANADAVRDSVDRPLAGWRVFADADQDGVLDPLGELGADHLNRLVHDRRTSDLYIQDRNGATGGVGLNHARRGTDAHG